MFTTRSPCIKNTDFNSGAEWFMSVISATGEAEAERSQGQLQQKDWKCNSVVEPSSLPASPSFLP